MHPILEGECPKEEIHAPRGSELHAKNWDTEAAMRMLMNNLDPKVASKWEELIIYGGSGRAVRTWHEYHRTVNALLNLENDETLCMQSGKPVYIAPTHENAPRVIIANSNIVPTYTDQFDKYDQMGLTMYGQMTAGSWIYIGSQGIIQGTYQTYRAVGKKEFNLDSLEGKFILTAGMGAMGGAQPLAGAMTGATILDVEVRKERIQRKVDEGFCDKMVENLDDALALVARGPEKKGRGLSIGLVGNAAEVYPDLVRRNVTPDIVTDQTSAHALLDYVPIGNLEELDALRKTNEKEYKDRSLASIKLHVAAILEMKKRGAIAVDYGNGLRGQAKLSGLLMKDENDKWVYPGFVAGYIRDLFSQGKGPFRLAALSGNPEDINKIDKMLLERFAEDTMLTNWINLARERVPFTGLPARICWLGYGDRETAGVEINKMVRNKDLEAPIVIGRDHLDCGSVASPERETEEMKDGSDAIADWPLLNFALNTANGASWVSFHNGGGVGIGKALHAGMVMVADGTAEREKRLRRVLTVDPGIGVARHLDAGEPVAIETAKKKGVKIPV